MKISVEHKKVCPVCGKEFTTTYSRAVYCSRECAAISARKKEYQHELERMKNDPVYKNERSKKNAERAKAKRHKEKFDVALAMANDIHAKAFNMTKAEFVRYIVDNTEPKKGGVYDARAVRISEE